MDERIYYIWLTVKLSLNSQKISQAISAFANPTGVYHAKPADLKTVSGLTRVDVKNLADKDLKQAESIMQSCSRLHVKIMTLNDPHYPERLLNITNPPHILYMMGELPDIDNELCIGVVGTRSATPYGLKVAGNLSYQLAKKNVCIISGMARGIDSYAHMGALKGAGKTVAVLGCGIDVVYPPENAKLKSAIEANGVVITEYPPQTPPYPKNFPARNRIISGLCAGVLVVEAARRSGALITASLALEQGRDVFAVPGNIDNDKHGGTNDLIKDGAKAVSDIYDILSEYEGVYLYKIRSEARYESVKIQNNKEENCVIEQKKEPLRIPDDLDKDQKEILTLLMEGGLHIDKISEKTGLLPHKVNALLTELELEGFITALPGKVFTINTKGEV